MPVFQPFRTSLPRPADPARATDLRREWRTAADEFAPEDAAFAHRYAEEADGTALLDAVFGNSPFLTRLVFAYPAILRLYVDLGADAAMAHAIAPIVEAPATDIPELMRTLRVAKSRAALAVALADLCDKWTLQQVVTALSKFADICVQAAVNGLLQNAHDHERIRLVDRDKPMENCGYAVLAMGKLGALELNYSSDIDLLVLFDPARLPYIGNKSPQEFAVTLTKELVRIMQERTGDGYVFRTDLRLRPDSTSIAVSLAAAQSYYESYGQNWERAAMIKARYVAGDPAIAQEFLRGLQPFLWRKSLDFYALQDIHSIKRQIYAHRGGGSIKVGGHNIKLGRGGIREIEFFAQTQQLIWGGRLSDTRVAQTLAALDALARRGFISVPICDDLSTAYIFLRRLEHRLQMVADEQTQTLPATAEGLTHIALFSGYETPTQFEADVEAALKTVETHYAALFEDSPSLAIEGNLVFTGTEDDPDTMATLRRLGFSNPSTVAAAVRTWHHGRYRATRSDRARQLLTEIMPGLLTSFGKTAEPDAAFIRFDRCLAEQQSGVQLLSVFQANPHLLDLVAEIMGDAPRLADHLARNPALLDYVLEPDFYAAIPDLDEMKSDLALSLEVADSFEGVLDACRRWANDERFRIGVHTLRGLISPAEAARHFSDVAEAVLCILLPEVGKEFAKQSGTVPGAAVAILAYGKLGSRELTPTSDLDLVIIYTGPADSVSGGPRSLSIQAYYMRFVQRLMTALTLLTREGILYRIDLRLRPDGQQGPIACSLEAFAKYHRESAWTWEHMALTRARVVAGDATLGASISEIIHEVLVRPRDAGELVAAVADMRGRIRKEHNSPTSADQWNLKHRSGGLIDAEFIIQYLLLRTPTAIPPLGSSADLSAPAAIRRLAASGTLGTAPAEALTQGHSFWSALQVMLRLTLGEEIPADLPRGLQSKLAAITGTSDFHQLEDMMRQRSHDISALFRDAIERPAAALDRTPSGTAP